MDISDDQLESSASLSASDASMLMEIEDAQVTSKDIEDEPGTSRASKDAATGDDPSDEEGKELLFPEPGWPELPVPAGAASGSKREAIICVYKSPTSRKHCKRPTYTNNYHTHEDENAAKRSKDYTKALGLSNSIFFDQAEFDRQLCSKSCSDNVVKILLERRLLVDEREGDGDSLRQKPQPDPPRCTEEHHSRYPDCYIPSDMYERAMDFFKKPADDQKQIVSEGLKSFWKFSSRDRKLADCEPDQTATLLMELKSFIKETTKKNSKPMHPYIRWSNCLRYIKLLCVLSGIDLKTPGVLNLESFFAHVVLQADRPNLFDLICFVVHYYCRSSGLSPSSVVQALKHLKYFLGFFEKHVPVDQKERVLQMTTEAERFINERIQHFLAENTYSLELLARLPPNAREHVKIFNMIRKSFLMLIENKRCYEQARAELEKGPPGLVTSNIMICGLIICRYNAPKSFFENFTISDYKSGTKHESSESWSYSYRQSGESSDAILEIGDPEKELLDSYYQQLVKPLISQNCLLETDSHHFFIASSEIVPSQLDSDTVDSWKTFDDESLEQAFRSFQNWWCPNIDPKLAVEALAAVWETAVVAAKTTSEKGITYDVRDKMMPVIGEKSTVEFDSVVLKQLCESDNKKTQMLVNNIVKVFSCEPKYLELYNFLMVITGEEKDTVQETVNVLRQNISKLVDGVGLSFRHKAVTQAIIEKLFKCILSARIEAAIHNRVWKHFIELVEKALIRCKNQPVTYNKDRTLFLNGVTKEYANSKKNIVSSVKKMIDIKQNDVSSDSVQNSDEAFEKFCQALGKQLCAFFESLPDDFSEELANDLAVKAQTTLLHNEHALVRPTGLLESEKKFLLGCLPNLIHQNQWDESEQISTQVSTFEDEVEAADNEYDTRETADNERDLNQVEIQDDGASSAIVTRRSLRERNKLPMNEMAVMELFRMIDEDREGSDKIVYIRDLRDSDLPPGKHVPPGEQGVFAKRMILKNFHICLYDAMMILAEEFENTVPLEHRIHCKKYMIEYELDLPKKKQKVIYLGHWFLPKFGPKINCNRQKTNCVVVPIKYPDYNYILESPSISEWFSEHASQGYSDLCRTNDCILVPVVKVLKDRIEPEEQLFWNYGDTFMFEDVGTQYVDML